MSDILYSLSAGFTLLLSILIALAILAGVLFLGRFLMNTSLILGWLYIPIILGLFFSLIRWLDWRRRYET